jgi:hypothetical protein
VRFERVREFGAVYLALALWRRSVLGSQWAGVVSGATEGVDAGEWWLGGLYKRLASYPKVHNVVRVTSRL